MNDVFSVLITAIGSSYSLALKVALVCIPATMLFKAFFGKRFL